MYMLKTNGIHIHTTVTKCSNVATCKRFSASRLVAPYSEFIFSVLLLLTTNHHDTMAGVDVSPYTCPVCYDFFKSAKLLPCYHLVCKCCAISWLQATEGRGNCPVCRAPMFPADPEDEEQVEAQVDRLHSDFATQALADSHKILEAPNECTMCKDNVAGHNFCLECSVKLCTPCTIYHKELPGTSHHRLEELSKLTVKTLAARRQIKCNTHTHQVVEVYCPSHGELMCCRCGLTTHRDCRRVKEIRELAMEERQKSKDRLGRLKEKENEIAKQLDGAKQQLKAMRKTANNIFDDLSESVEKQRRDVNHFIQAEEDTIPEVEKALVSMALPLRNIENLVLESPDDGLLEMLQQLESRLDNLESQMEVICGVRDVGCLVFHDQIIRDLKSNLEKLGQMQQPQILPTSTPATGATPTTSATASGQVQQPQQQALPTSAAEPTPRRGWTRLFGFLRMLPGMIIGPKSEGAALARVLKVGDRVKLAPGTPCLRLQGVQPRDTGTVKAIPTRIMAVGGRDSPGLVDVRWDRAGERCHCMGRNNIYDLILA